MTFGHTQYKNMQTNSVRCVIYMHYFKCPGISANDLHLDTDQDKHHVIYWAIHI